MSNQARGEVSLALNGMNYVLRPTFEAISCIETQIGKSLFTLLSQFGEKGITLNEQIQIIKIGVNASGDKVDLTDKELGEIIIKSSITSVIASVCTFIQNSLGIGMK